MAAPKPEISHTLHAPAKLNLCLELLGKRSDGFHELRSVMATVRWCDTLRVTSRSADEPIGLRVNDHRVASDPAEQPDVVPPAESNLVHRALTLLRESAGETASASARLVKRIPSQAGLGGGSSDAAAALIAGAHVWRIDWGWKRLAALAARLGSDVPFFVHAIARQLPLASASGRGEHVDPARGIARFHAVIVKPPRGLSTAAVYAACDPADYVANKGPDRCRITMEALRAGDRAALRQSACNGLERAAERVAPWLAGLRDAYNAAGCAVHQLSGSGSAYFGLTRSVGEARRVAARLRALRLGQVRVAALG